MRFAWDEDKNKKNQKKHGISFQEALTVFFDDFAYTEYDTDHSKSEERFLIIGMSNILRILIVAYCEKKDDKYRIISARKANKKEKQDYKERIK